jgi:hypothetical protein
MFTTAGVTCSSIGASEGIGWPLIAGGKAARLAPGHAPIRTAANRLVSQCRRRKRRGGMKVLLGEK